MLQVAMVHIEVRIIRVAPHAAASPTREGQQAVELRSKLRYPPVALPVPVKRPVDVQTAVYTVV